MHRHADDHDGPCSAHEHDEGFFGRYHHLLLPALSGAFLLAGWLLDISGVGPRWLAYVLYGAAYVSGAYEVVDCTVRALFKYRLDIDFLMLAAGIGAAAIGLYAEGALLFFLFSLGHGLEHHAMGRARNAIRSLGSITPTTAILVGPDGERTVSIETINPGDRVRVRPGSRIPVDGRIDEGSSAIDQAAITGESMPVECTTGDRVFAGSLNGDGALVVEVEKLASNTTMARMIRLVEENRSRQGNSQRLASRFTRIYVPVVLLGTLLLILVPPLVGILEWKEAFLRGMTVLVGASPCALAISTPSAILSGIAHAARNGILIKGGLHLENLGALDVIAMDKTGTLTTGRPELTDIMPIDELDEVELLTLIGAVEFQSTHPLARSISRACQARQLTLPTANDVRNIPGVGVEARVKDRSILIGGSRLLDSEDAADWRGREQATREIERLEGQARTVMLAVGDDRILGLIALADDPRAGSRATVERLHAIGIREVVMLTGDNATVAEQVGERVGVDRIESNLMPEDKIRVVRELRETKARVGMVGDGVNDAPALAAADVGIAMGAGGTDVALETADVALMADDLDRLPYAIGLSRRVRRTILQNVLISMVVIGALVPFAALGVAPIWLAVILHEGSTLVVVLNALRLLGYRDPAAS
jgi:Cd2+/Zn2+-exporting ATPase